METYDETKTMTDRLDLGRGILGTRDSRVYVFMNKAELENYFDVSEGRLGDLEADLAEIKTACAEKTRGYLFREMMKRSDENYSKRRQESLSDLKGLIKKGLRHLPDTIDEAVNYFSLPLKRRRWKRERLNWLKQTVPAISECLANIGELVTVVKRDVTAYGEQAQYLKDALKNVQSDKEGKVRVGYEIEEIMEKMDDCLKRSENYGKTALHAYRSAMEDYMSESWIREVEIGEVRECLDEIAKLKSEESAKRRKEAELMVRLATEHSGL